MQNGFRKLLLNNCLLRKKAISGSVSLFTCKRNMASAATHTNKLINEKSPYLLQHAHNPVDWYPWGQEAFDKAKAEDKMIFLSVGYSTCHWCHVMERESFENPAIGALMNKLYVNIKVDREERPDVDKVYMTFVQATTHSGGWPMSVWLTPDLKPVVGGTYFPPDGAGNFGRPGFESVLEQIAKAWQDNRQKLIEQGTKITEALTQACQVKAESESAGLPETASVMKKCYDHLISSYDSSWGGYGSAPKFPQPVNFQFMMHFYHANKSKASGKAALDSVEKTLTYMSKGGIHDHVAQGFSRYSTDRRWHVPHFEKMLYDQGQLAAAYTEIYQASQKTYFAEILEDIFVYVSRDLSNPEGGFYSGEDADSYPTASSKEKKEGAFCVWTHEEIRSLLSKPVPGHDSVSLADVFCEHYNVKESGNVDPHQDPHNELTSQNVLIVLGSATETANKFELTLTDVEAALTEGRQILFDVRLKRPKPHRDTKMLAGWNGLMIGGLAKGGAALGRPDYVERAAKAAKFVKTHLYDSSTGELLRSVYAEEGTQNVVQLSEPIKGFADDYGFLIGGLLDLFEATGDGQWLEWAEKLQSKMDELFWDDSSSDSGGYFQSRRDDPTILIRMKDDQDGAEPSDNSKAAVNLIRLGNLTSKPAYKERVEVIFRTFADRLERIPYAVPKMTVALMMHTRPYTQVVIVSENRSDPEAIGMLKAVHTSFLPDKVIVWLNGETDSYLRQQTEYLRDMKAIDGKATAYVCKNFTCSLPVQSVDEMLKLIQS